MYTLRHQNWGGYHKTFIINVVQINFSNISSQKKSNYLEKENQKILQIVLQSEQNANSPEL